MMMQEIHLAVASTTSLPGEVARNLRQISEFSRRAAGDGARLLLTPELSATGYGNYAEVLETAEVAGRGPIHEALAKTAAETGVVICAGFVELAGTHKHLSHYAIQPGGGFTVQRKHRITPAEVPLEPVRPELDAYNAPAGHPGFAWELFEVGGVRFALAICADIGVPELHAELRRRGVQVVLAPAAAGGSVTERVRTEDLSSAEGRARYSQILSTVSSPGDSLLPCMEHGLALAAVNLCGYDGRRHAHLGQGWINNAMGEVLGHFHGLPNLDRQWPSYTSAVVNLADVLPSALV